MIQKTETLETEVAFFGKVGKKFSQSDASATDIEDFTVSGSWIVGSNVKVAGV